MKKWILFFMMIFFPALVWAQGSAENEKTPWSLYSGNWREFIAEEDSLQADVTNIKAPADTFWSRPFRGWPTGGIHMLVADTSGADSVNFTVDLFQYGYTISHPDSSKAIFMKTLSWRSTSSSTAATSITATGYYGAMLTDTAILPFRWWYLRYITATGHSQKTGNVSVNPIVNVFSSR